MSRIIGQKNLLHKLHTQPVPHFFILWGDKGSGKYMVSKQVAEHNNFNYVKVENNVDGIRQLIELTTALSTSTLFYIKGDTLTIQAQNALLKLAEEPPTKAYIMIGVRNIDNLLATIRSRAKTVIMDNYSYNDLEDVFERFGLPEPERQPDEDFDSVGGMILQKLGRFPAPGEQVQVYFGGLQFEVLRSGERRIESVLCRPIQPQPEPNEDSKE